MYKMLRDIHRGMLPKVTNFAQDLVRIPSVSRDEERIAERILQEMKTIGFDKILRDEWGNVVALLYGNESLPTVLLNSHMDTVDPGDGAAWKESPCSGRIENGRLYGVGASDCKGGLAAQLYAGALLKRSLLPLRGNLVIAATVAEQNGRGVGVRGLLEHTLPSLELKPDYAILGEPTGLGLYYGHDGWLELEIKVQGRNPFKVEDAARAILEETVQNRGVSPKKKAFTEVAVREPVIEEQNGIRRVTIQMERRLGASEPAEEVMGQIKRDAVMAAQAAGGVAVDVAVRQETQTMYTGQTRVVRHVCHAWATDPFHPLLDRSRQALAAAGCRVAPGKWELGRLGMGTAGGTLVTEFHVPTIGYGPGNEETAHSVNEYAEIANIHEAVYGTAVIIHGLIGIPVFGWTSDEI
ncbi:MAG TPA: M20/M25/M40 family metallo-hydrolase [bacterium]|nr:M20/M25/M40 family metallo-hydrolase [bacterium]HOL92781.1 M20/M25/M40 family metallo-hydrolase [bacterium]HPO99004.1 M20/M25/M40 family metallo-hydrolase [bacterium]HXK95339.1 M20/M25/M40 family metallo-hydrolase [bacterium]